MTQRYLFLISSQSDSVECSTPGVIKKSGLTGVDRHGLRNFPCFWKGPGVRGPAPVTGNKRNLRQAYWACHTTEKKQKKQLENWLKHYDIFSRRNYFIL